MEIFIQSNHTQIKAILTEKQIHMVLNIEVAPLLLIIFDSEFL